MSMDYRAIDFLNNFDEETRKHIIEFGKRISSDALSADVYLIMARKAICFVDFLCEVKLASLNGVVVSDRILDMNTTWLKGKTVTIIDDALVSGTTLKKVIDKLEHSGVEKLQVFVLSINKKWYNEKMLSRADNSTYLAKPCYYNTNDKCMQMCYDIVKALSTIPKPYDIDFPLYGEYSISESKLNEMLNSSWSTFNVTSASHISNSYASRKATPQNVLNEYESITFIPSSTITNNLFSLTGIDFHNSCILKVRSYIRKRTKKKSEYSISFLPFVIFNEITEDDIDSIIDHIFRQKEVLNTINSEMTTYESKFRLIQYVVATFLMKIFFYDMFFYNDIFDENSIDAKLDYPIKTRLQYIFTPNIVDIILDSIKNGFSHTNTLNVKSDFNNKTNNNQVNEVNSCNCITTYDILSNKFMELYEKRELKARSLAKEHGKDVFLLNKYKNDMRRLEVGYTFQDLVLSLPKNTANEFIVSIFLDYAIDTGIAVPITYSNNHKIVRAYRHGEDVIFTDIEAKQLAYMIACFINISGRQEIPALLLEKLLTTFIRFGLHDSIFEKYDYKNIHSQERDYIKIAYYIHGTTARVLNSKLAYNSTPIITSDTKSYWLRDVLLSKDLIVKTPGRDDLSAYYVDMDTYEHLSSEHNSIERGRIAKRIAHVIGYLYNKKTITEKDLILLNASFGHDQIIPALLAEVRIVLDNYPFFKHTIIDNYDKWHSMNSMVAFRKNNFFTALNSGFMKLKSYYSDEPRKIIEKVRNSNPNDFVTDHFYDEFERYWDEKISNIKEEIPADIERLINLASVYIIQYNLLYRTIEYLIFKKHIGSEKILQYFDELKTLISNKSTKNRTEILDVIHEFNQLKKNANLLPYFQICYVEINSNTVFDDDLISHLAMGTQLKEAIKGYIEQLTLFFTSNNILNYKQALIYANNAINDQNIDIDTNINDILSHLSQLNQRAEEFIVQGCKYINNRGEVEKPIEYPNIIVIHPQNKEDLYLFKKIEAEIHVRQKKLHTKNSDAELLYQYNGETMLIMSRGNRSDEAIMIFARNIQETLNYNNELRIHTILNLNSPYSPYRFKSCVASANIIPFCEWYNNFKQALLSIDSNFIITSELDLSMVNKRFTNLKYCILKSQPHSGLLGKEFKTMYLTETNNLTKCKSTKGLTIGVICAKENERDGIITAVQNHFNIELDSKLDEKENHRLIDVGTINLSGFEHKIIITKCEQGNTSASTAYSSLSHFKPDYIVFVGIAGTCNPVEIQLGDVLLPSEIFDATLKKEKNDAFQLRAATYRIPGNHVGFIQLFVRNINKNGLDFKVHNSRLLSDNTVYACNDSEILKSVLTFNDKTDGIEMESAGIYSADYERNKTKYGVFTIRGISDNANSVKDDKYHNLAIKNASITFCKFINFMFDNINTIKGMKKD